MAEQSEYPTLSYTQIPYPLRLPFVETGYRLLHKPWSYYYVSILKWHNETLNIWTHVIASFIIIFYGLLFNEKYDLVHSSDGNKILICIFGCVPLTIFSSFAHLLGSRSFRSGVIFYFVDYSGIALYGYTTSLGALYICGDINIFETLRPFYIWLGVVLITICFAINCGALILIVNATLIQKCLMIAPYTLFGIYISVPLLPRYWYCYKDNGCALSSLNHITLCYVLFILEAIVYASHFPERWKPKSFDYCGQSHQIFHVCALATVVAQIYAIVNEIASGHLGQLEFDFWKSLAGYVYLMMSMIVVVLCYLPSIDKLSQEWTSSTTRLICET